ncbi:MAG TPA: helix-turn-helix transcriptional regulator [Streptosporangiaceae bacterium]|nr:helix-turn-helix transcriptional regulator [Streptosporangiaceae bacterium]
MKPARQLRPLVASYVDFDMAGWPPGRHRGLPDGTLVLVVSTNAPLTVRRAGRADVVAAATVAGLRSSPVGIVHDGTQRGVQLALTPRGSRALLGLPAAALAQGVWPLEEVIGRRAHELADRLASAPGPAGRARVLDTVLARWAVAADYPAAVDAAWRRLAASAGRLPVASVAAGIGLGRRHLGQLVRTELGLTPKTVARILRFDHACRCLRSGRTTALAETAVMCGYFDQAHLTSEWKQLGGCTPGEWMSEELPFLQDHRSGRGAR